MKIDKQMTFADVDPEYKEWLDKFKPKKTTDDCYTPPNIYDAVLRFAVKEYGVDPEKVVRPFWPGGDYLKYDYPDDCYVVDNPPFSILTQICRDYCNHGIKFFLFSPYLTNFGVGRALDITHIITCSSITYENGARVDTAFVTNMDDKYRCRTAVSLGKEIKRLDSENTKTNKPELPVYTFPPYVVTSSMLGYIAKYGVEFAVEKKDAVFVSALDSMRAKGKSVFGGGYLLSEKAAAEKVNAIRWPLSDREKRIVESLGTRKECGHVS